MMHFCYWVISMHYPQLSRLIIDTLHLLLQIELLTSGGCMKQDLISHSIVLATRISTQGNINPSSAQHQIMTTKSHSGKGYCQT
jgi:hypothetical protein